MVNKENKAQIIQFSLVPLDPALMIFQLMDAQLLGVGIKHILLFKSKEGDKLIERIFEYNPHGGSDCARFCALLNEICREQPEPTNDLFCQYIGSEFKIPSYQYNSNEYSGFADWEGHVIVNYKSIGEVLKDENS